MGRSLTKRLQTMQESQEKQEVNLPEELKDKLSAIKALVTVHSLLGVGMFQHRHTPQLTESLKFLESLHKQVMEEALQHPDADKAPELVEYKQQLVMEALQKSIKEQGQE